MTFLAAITQQSGHVITISTSMGASIAVVCSWERHRSILWAILAGALSWLYVIWFAVTRRPGEG